MEVLFASVPVAKLRETLDGYEFLVGRAPVIVPNGNEVMWRAAGDGWLFVLKDPGRAGRTVVTMSGTDLDQFVAELSSRGVNAGPIEALGDAGRESNVVVADGNVISWIQVAVAS